MAPREQKAREAQLFAELADLYREVDALFSGSRCDASTECCRFGITGREPQVTSLELAYVLRAQRARGGKLGPKRRALPLSTEPERERACPLLDHQGKCSVYEARPLGCRTFFCERAHHEREPSRKELLTLVRKLQELAVRHERDGDRPRALSRAVE